MLKKKFEIQKFFVGTDRTRSLSEQSADSSEEPTRRPSLSLNVILYYRYDICKVSLAYFFHGGTYQYDFAGNTSWCKIFHKFHIGNSYHHYSQYFLMNSFLDII